MRLSSRVLLSAVMILLPTSLPLLGQAVPADISGALIGRTISPGIEVCFAGDSDTEKYLNNGPKADVKSEVYPDGHQKFTIEDGLLRGFMRLPAEYKRSFYAGTQFRIDSVKLNKKDVELIILPVPADGHIGVVKLMLGDKYSTMPLPELVAKIDGMLRLDTVSLTAPKRPTAPSRKVSLDCKPNREMASVIMKEVIFDEGEESATFQTVGTPLPMQPADFSDVLIQWNDGTPGDARVFYSLSRSTGVLTVKGADDPAQTNNAPGPVLYTCDLRVKRF